MFYTAIWFDPELNEYARRDVCTDAWKQEQEIRKPIASWRSIYRKAEVEARPEIAPKASAQELLQRFIEEGDPKTENARYILALMLERKRQLVQTAEKEIDGHKMLFYENKKTGEIFIVRDPELLLEEVVQIQEEVATILAFGGPAAEAAKAVGVTLTVDGVVPAELPAESPETSDAPDSTDSTVEPEPVAESAADETATEQPAEAAETESQA